MIMIIVYIIGIVGEFLYLYMLMMFLIACNGVASICEVKGFLKS